MSLATSLEEFSSHLGFRARKIDAADTQKAFALAQLKRLGLDIAEWREMLDRHQRTPSPDSIWITIEDLRAYMHAIFFCHLIYIRQQEFVLRVTDMIAADLPGPTIVAVAVECAAHLAKQSGAMAVEFDFDGVGSEHVLAAISTQLAAGGWMATPRTVLRFRPRLH